MKIKEILAAGRPSVSFEVFPPKKDAPFAPVKEAIERLAKQRPAFMSVTYGASGNAQANTTAIASHVQSCGVTALAHLTCISATREGIAKEAAALRNAGIENVLCLRGDAPKDAAPSGDFLHAVDLVRALAGSGFCLGTACRDLSQRRFDLSQPCFDLASAGCDLFAAAADLCCARVF